MKKIKNTIGIVAGIALMFVFYLCAGSEEWSPFSYTLVAVAIVLVGIILLTNQTPD